MSGMEMFKQLCDMEYKEKLLFRIYMLEELKKLQEKINKPKKKKSNPLNEKE